MKAFVFVLCSLAILAPANSSPAQTPGANGQLTAFSAFIDNPKPPDTSTPALTLDEIERIALAENPEIHVAARKVSMAEAHVPTTGKLDDPQFMVRNWQVPLNKPWDYNAAQNMLMLSQSLPGPGKRPLQTSIAQSDVTAAEDELASVRLQVRVETRKAFFDLLLAQEEMRIQTLRPGARTNQDRIDDQALDSTKGQEHRAYQAHGRRRKACRWGPGVSRVLDACDAGDGYGRRARGSRTQRQRSGHLRRAT